MSMLDFTNEEEQKEFTYGPVPEGSIVMVGMEVLTPHSPAPENDHIAMAQSGLRQIYCKFTVDHGTYKGVQFRQNITLPISAQQMNLLEGQKRACNIGGAMLKAICLAARKPPKIKDVTSLTGLKFPARLRINQRPYEKDDGRVFWNNELAFIITPEANHYAEVVNGGEVINETGAVTGKGAAANGNEYNSSQSTTSGSESWTASPNMDEVPFS